MNSSANETLRNVAGRRADLQMKMDSPKRDRQAAQICPTTAAPSSGSRAHDSAKAAGTPVAGLIHANSRNYSRGYAMTQIRKLLTATAIAATAAAFAQGAFAQTATPAAGDAPTMAPATAPSQAPAAAGIAQPAPAPQNLTAPQPTDPLVQKRNANAAASAEYRSAKKSANSEYKDAKKQAKTQYKSEVKDAKINRKADRQANDSEMKDQMSGQSAQQQGGAQQP
jgi:hypothetical protein